MSDDFDDAFGGSGMPTKDQIIKTRDYLKRHNRSYAVIPVHKELEARGFTVSQSTVGRMLKGVPGGNPAPARSPVAAAEKRRANVKGGAKDRGKKEQPAAVATRTIDDVQMASEALVAALPKMAELVAEANTSTQLAIRENRGRMALNIIIQEAMAAARPEVLLLDMRATAAVIDAMTVASKLSGGASIDIQIPSGAPANGHANGNGHDMIDVTPPKSSLAADLEEFRRKKAAERDKRA